MERRTFLSTLGVATLAAPLIAEGQSSKATRIGYLSGNPQADTQEALDAFRAKLNGLGYRDGQDFLFEYRYGDGQYDRLPQLAADLVRLKLAIILTYGTPASLAAKNATRTIPIVFAAVADPLAARLVASLTQPGLNVTGVTTNNPELSTKRLSLLKEAVPTASRVAVLADPDFPATPNMVAETRGAGQALGLKVQVLDVRQPQDLAKAFSAMSAAKTDALIVLPDALFIAHRQRIVELAAGSRVPAIYHLRQFVDAGGLISYGVDYVESFQQAAVLVDKILKGAKPADLPVEQPWRFILCINLKTAKALGLTIPQSLLLRADHVIQ
jgi:putative ABC transport system substrate-binding protein